MDEGLLRALDDEVRRRKTDRSKLIRTAVDRLLQELRRSELEALHRRGYTRRPLDEDELGAWEEAQAWPET
jgi:metal-responsive CopG/Arc/MetJ family transcriptional regulator